MAEEMVFEGREWEGQRPFVISLLFSHFTVEEMEAQRR